MRDILRRSKNITLILTLSMFAFSWAQTANASSITITKDTEYMSVWSFSDFDYSTSEPDNGTDVPVVVTDPHGKKLGYDPRTDKWLREFPGTHESPYCGDDMCRSEESWLYVHELDFYISQGSSYTIEAIGKGPELFKLYIDITSSSSLSEQFSFKGVIDKDMSRTFKVTYNGPNAPVLAITERIATPASLKQDIMLARKIMSVKNRTMYLINNDGVMKSLLAKADAAEASIAKANNTAAINQLEALINEVNAQKGKHIGEEAIEMLTEDAEYLMKSLQ